VNNPREAFPAIVLKSAVLGSAFGWFVTEGGTKMKTYIVLLNYTEQGIKKIKESPSRLDAARKAAESMGGKIKEWYLVMGQYDAVVVAEAPDDEVLSRVMLTIGAQGNVHTQTLSALTEAEYRKVCASLP
jgi:uncharacterized protein with GYD domain